MRERSWHLSNFRPMSCAKNVPTCLYVFTCCSCGVSTLTTTRSPSPEQVMKHSITAGCCRHSWRAACNLSPASSKSNETAWLYSRICVAWCPPSNTPQRVIQGKSAFILSASAFFPSSRSLRMTSISCFHLLRRSMASCWMVMFTGCLSNLLRKRENCLFLLFICLVF